VLFKNPVYIYGLRLLIDGKWETIAMDTSFFYIGWGVTAGCVLRGEDLGDVVGEGICEDKWFL
jgi:hypothetical protein